MSLKDIIAQETYMDVLLATWVEQDKNARWDYYADGYHAAAFRLVELLLAGERGYIDLWQYPIVFLYRHSIELYMKYLINRYSLFVDKRVNPAVGHKLNNLWDTLYPLLKEASLVSAGGCGYNSDDDPDLNDAICFVNNEDPTSTKFRYPNDKSGLHSLDNVEHYPLSTFIKVAEFAITYLDGLGISLTEYQDFLAEYGNSLGE